MSTTRRSILVLLGICVTCTWLASLPETARGQGQPPNPSRRRGRRTESNPAAAQPQEVPGVQADKPDDRYFAVTGATVHTVTGPTLEGPTLLCKNGKIIALGHDVVVPEQAETLDARGFHLYPGLVAVQSGGIVGAEPPEDNTDVFGLSLTLGLAGGVTTVVSGNTAVKLTYGTLEEHVLKRNLFYSISYGRQNLSERQKLRGTLDRVRQYLRQLEDYELEKTRNPAAKEPDKAWIKGDFENALKLLRHETTAVASANTVDQLRDLADLAQQYGFQLVLRGANEGWIVAPELARAGVRAVVTPRTRVDRDEELNRPNGSSIENARILHQHGVPLAILPLGTGISLGGIAGRDLMHLPMEAAFAVRGGLPEDAALRAITIDAARILGVDHRVGSIEEGKDADFAIVDGDILHYMTLVRWTIVNGLIAYDKQKEGLLDHIRPDGKQDAPPPPDYWPRSLGDPVSGTTGAPAAGSQ